MSIISLPLELLHLIGSNLDQKDIRNLISTSHRMHSVFQRKLYTNVTIGLRNANAAQSFLYAVARNPGLAGYVQSLALACWETYLDWETNREPQKTTERPNFDGDLIRKLVDEATDYTEEEKSKWLQDLEEFYDDAWLALLIPRLTGLRKIGFEWPFGSSHVSKMLNKAAINGGVCFPHLEEVNMCWYDTENAVRSYQMHPFFKFPSVRKVSGWKVAENAKEEEEEEVEEDDFELKPTEILKGCSLPPKCSNVTDIDLSLCNAAGGMQQWIQACKALKSFRITHGGVLISYDDSQPRKLYNSLSLHKSTLEAVWFEHDEQGGDGDNDDEWMGSFVDFAALKFLRLYLPNLVGINEQGLPARKISDVIPSSLETLFLDIWWDWFIDVLDDLAEIATSRKFSKIATFHIETCNSKPSSPEEDAKVDWLQQRCREVGVACHVHDVRTWEDMEGIQLRNSLWPQCEAEDLEFY
ncbi:hypothetical protein N7481_006450 [Penicillium waksmanii]|uniref:uncharacterized protein n=1 Tax=Penicillium waksmanii TaxID=69791 RepID=UPI002549671B|nr:uncharacterized protein N7481_006450 [Penicillium waksmanii]KAJ5984351.1 hypothetical protein N7481_006450 [Penicillium waksmanii]